MKIPISKIRAAAQSILPKGASFSVRSYKSTVRGKRIVRVLTEAWPRTQLRVRIARLLAAVKTQIPEAELQQVLRFSVVSPSELKEYFAATRVPHW